MKPKMILRIVAIFVVLLLFFYWIVLRNKMQDVSKQEPYRYMLNRELITTSEVIIVENTTLPGVKNDYPWQISTSDETDTTRVKHTKLPAGSTVTFTKAIHYTNSTSGIKYAILSGNATIKGNAEAYNVIYNWGIFKTICLDEPCNYWEYKKEFWGK